MLAKIRATCEGLVNATTDLQTLERVAAVLKSTAITAKAEADLETLRRDGPSGGSRFWTQGAPLITTAILAATLAFQIVQHRENLVLQQQSAEDAQYRLALQSMEDPQMQTGQVAFPLFKSFFTMPRFRQQVREVAIGLLQGVVEIDMFESLFAPVKQYTDSTNFMDVAKLDAALWRSWTQFGDEIRAAKARQLVGHGANAPANSGPFGPPPPGGFPGDDSPSPERLDRMRRAKADELISCSTFLAGLLKERRTNGRVPSHIDLSEVDLGYRDLRNADLSNAVLNGMALDSADVTSADLGGDTLFKRSSWKYTKWWLAQRMDTSLVKYLISKYPPKDTRDSAYLSNVARLIKSP
jgi:hypothetical protein